MLIKFATKQLHCFWPRNQRTEAEQKVEKRFSVTGPLKITKNEESLKNITNTSKRKITQKKKRKRRKKLKQRFRRSAKKCEDPEMKCQRTGSCVNQ